VTIRRALRSGAVLGRYAPASFVPIRIPMIKLVVSMAAVAVLLAGCERPTATDPRVTSSGGAGPTVEYSGERSGQADEQARQTCEQQGKQAVPRSMQPGPSGGTVRSYDCR
jgi:hypothetical protein